MIDPILVDMYTVCQYSRGTNTSATFLKENDAFIQCLVFDACPHANMPTYVPVYVSTHVSTYTPLYNMCSRLDLYSSSMERTIKLALKPIYRCNYQPSIESVHTYIRVRTYVRTPEHAKAYKA